MNSTSSAPPKTNLSTKETQEFPVESSQVIQPSKGWDSLGLRDLWEYRELLYFMVWREISGAYRQTALGISWLFLRPVINMFLLTLVFGWLVQVPSDDIPYPLFSLAALLPWGFFSNAVLRASRSLVENMHVISKVYFPRMVIPIAGSLSGLIDFAASLLILMVALLIYQYPLRVEMLWLPGLLLVSLAFSLAVGLWLATLSVRFRDVFLVVFAVFVICLRILYGTYSILSLGGSLQNTATIG